MDLLIVIVQIISVSVQNDQLKLFKILRMVRILRPLRLISRNEGLRLAVDTLIHVVPRVFNVAIVSLIFYFIFSIFSVTFNKGGFFSCHTEELEFGEEVAS